MVEVANRFEGWVARGSEMGTLVPACVIFVGPTHEPCHVRRNPEVRAFTSRCRARRRRIAEIWPGLAVIRHGRGRDMGWPGLASRADTAAGA